MANGERLYSALLRVHAEKQQQKPQRWSVTKLFLRRSPFGTPRSKVPWANAPEHKPKDRLEEQRVQTSNSEALFDKDLY